MSKILHPRSHSLLLHLFSFFFFSTGMQSNNTDCPSYNCSNIAIRYPFWRIGTDRLCGYEGFGINCITINQQELPIITLGRERYKVRNIIYEYQSIVLVDYDVINTDCPRVQHNISWEALPFGFTELNVHLRFHFNCTDVPPFATPIPCLDEHDGRKSCANRVDTEPENFDWEVYSCADQVITTAVFREIGFLRNTSDALKNGFELQWGMNRMEDCRKCQESGGRCVGPNTTEFMCFCPNNSITRLDCKGAKSNFKFKLVIGVGSGLLSVVLILVICCITKPSPTNYAHLFTPKTEDDKNVEAFLIRYGSLRTKRYKYNDIKKITNSFCHKLGQGGFGTVYKGKLSDGRLVAVKVLNSSKARGQEFINEVASIGRTSHVNIVALLGFCFEYRKRALVYEFMPNGSLEKIIYSHVPLMTSEHIGLPKLYEISLGIARGLDYLHRGCNTRILHLDIKPHNILLDEDYCPKIADFGIAKLYSRKESIVSLSEARGTIGYIAPEVFYRSFGVVSHKSDVYSFGMLLLEMLGGRKNVDGFGSGRTSEIYFPDWIYIRLQKQDFLLDSVTTTAENYYARKMAIVGLWCIQADPNHRPSINDVIEMLEGSIDTLEVPPKPFFSTSL